MRSFEYDGDGIHTERAKRKLRKALKRSKKLGHVPTRISKLGYVELYGCMNVDCDATIDVWDSPASVNGPMQWANCCNPKFSTIKTFFKNIFKGRQVDNGK
tara:strand:+ start:110 stop:412 length:303 start_codon:yes stop_codon:yes gene_type:complete